MLWFVTWANSVLNVFEGLAQYCRIYWTWNLIGEQILTLVLSFSFTFVSVFNKMG